MTDNLAPAGSSSYHSNTMNVGDGTWDKSRNTFLLPNLQGLNFATTRYNGMGNRFKGEPEYHTLILGHGVLAAITFIGIMPIALFLARYGYSWPGGRVSFKLHVYLQILTVFLSTVVLVLGWFAVGPERSLSNPHHGIGVAVYVLILAQFLYGSCWFRRERRRKQSPRKLPLTVWIHRLLGRTTAVLAFINIGLGLTLYGSPKTLFILYALAGAALLFTYLALAYHFMPVAGGPAPPQSQGEYYSDYGSHVSGSARPPRRKQGRHWGRDILAAGGVVGAYEWFKHRKDRKKDDRDEEYDDRTDHGYASHAGRPPSGPPPPMNGGRPGYPSAGPPMAAGGFAGARSGRPPSQGGESRGSWDDEKYSDRQQRPNWRTRALEATGAFAAYEGVRGLFGRGRRRDDYSEDGSYGSALGGNRPIPTETDVSRVEAGQAPTSPETPRVNMGGAQAMTPTMTPSRPSRGAAGGASVSDDSRAGHGPRPLLNADAPLSEHVRELGPIAGVREWNKQRRARKEADRADNIRQQELENEENFNRRNSDHYPRPQDANNRRGSTSGTLLTGPGDSEMTRPNARPDTSHPPLPAEAGAWPANYQNEAYVLPPPPPGPPPNTFRGDGYGSRPDLGPATMPEGAVNPDPERLLRDNTAANESSAYGWTPRLRDEAAGAAVLADGTGAGGLAATAARNRSRGQSGSPSRGQDSRNRLQRPSRRGSATSASASNPGLIGSQRPENPNSPPVSVQVKMHNDGRHVTLRRLNDDEVAASREARRQERRQRRRGSSPSSAGEDGGPPLGQRYRRNGGMRDSSAQPIRNVPPPPPMSSSAGASFQRASELNLPAPVVAQHSSPASQGMSPPTAPIAGSGMGYGTDQGTDVSAFADNRRRRRAERARREAEAGNSREVEFE